jgi:beta-glucanase (GH16 family)
MRAVVTRAAIKAKYGRRALLASASVLVLAGVTFVTVTARADVPATPDGFTLVFSDDFDLAADTSPSDEWLPQLGHRYENPPGADNWGTGEIAAHTADPANVSTDGSGNLAITPLRDTAGNWTSARIESAQEFAAPEGGVMRVEASLQVPNVTGEAGLGYWPAFWMLGAPFRGDHTNWPIVGEFDIMENVNGLDNTHGVLHCGVAPGGPCNEFNGVGASRACPGSTCQSGFHTYAFEWDRTATPEEFRWFVDGEQFHSVLESDLPADTYASATNHGYYIILNVAIGGAFPNGVSGLNTPVAATEPGHPMLVDYVAVWTSGG